MSPLIFFLLLLVGGATVGLYMLPTPEDAPASAPEPITAPGQELDEYVHKCEIHGTFPWEENRLVPCPRGP